MKRLFAGSAVAVCLLNGALAQSPIIVQPANAPAPAASAPQQSVPATKPADADVSSAIKLLQETKAANEELLQKQQATLQALDELQKEADQLRIYSKRS